MVVCLSVSSCEYQPHLLAAPAIQKKLHLSLLPLPLNELFKIVKNG